MCMAAAQSFHIRANLLQAGDGDGYSTGRCLGYPTPPSMERNSESGALDLVSTLIHMSGGCHTSGWHAFKAISSLQIYCTSTDEYDLHGIPGGRGR